MGLPLEARTPELWDTLVSIISETCTDAVCSSLPHHGPGELVSVPGCCTSTYYFVDEPHRLGHGPESRPGHGSGRGQGMGRGRDRGQDFQDGTLGT